jgi:hypothetical protein
VRRFAEWHAEDGKITREQGKARFADPLPEGDWFDGYNAGVEAVLISADVFLDELLWSAPQEHRHD